jgi:hypothetical protein
MSVGVSAPLGIIKSNQNNQVEPYDIMPEDASVQPLHLLNQAQVSSAASQKLILREPGRYAKRTI